MDISRLSTRRKTTKIYTTNSDELVSQIPQKKGRKNIRRNTLRKMIKRMSEMFTPNRYNKVHIASTTPKSSPLTNSLDLDDIALFDNIIRKGKVKGKGTRGGRTRRRRKGTKKRR